jgi:hypothetical protein
MSPVTQYIFDGTKWQNEVRTERSTVSNASTVDTFIIGTTRPVYLSPGDTRNNVGNKIGVARSNYSGSVNFANGPVNLSNLNISGIQNVVGAGHRFHNVLFNGSYSGTAGGGIVMCKDSSVSDLRLDFCEFAPATCGDRYNGIYGHDFTLSRSAIRRTVDGIGAYNQFRENVNVDVLGCWIGQLSWFDSDNGAHVDGTHNDGVQLGSGRYIKVVGTMFNGAKHNAMNPGNVTLDARGQLLCNPGNGVTPLALNSSNSSNRNPQQGQLFLGQHSAYFEIADIVFEDNWMLNGDCGFKLSSMKWGGTRAPVLRVSFKRNKFSGIWRDWGGSVRFIPARWDSNCTVNGVKRAGGLYDDTDGNVWEDASEVPSGWRAKPIKIKVDAV